MFTYNIFLKRENPLCVMAQRSAGFLYLASFKVGYTTAAYKNQFKTPHRPGKRPPHRPGERSRAVRHKGSKMKNPTKALRSGLIITVVKLFANDNCPNSGTIEGNTMNNSLILKYRGHLRSRTAQLIEDDSLDRSLLSG